MNKLKVLFITMVTIFSFGLVANAIHQGVINVNTATVEQLSQLPTISGEIAKNIVDYRNANGPFASIDELTKVKGVTRTLLDDIRPYLVLQGETTFRPEEYPGGHPKQMD